MSTHPQVEAFLLAAASMKANRYWVRDGHEQSEFLLALRDVVAEVCFHLDRNHVLDSIGQVPPGGLGHGPSDTRRVPFKAASVLIPCLDLAIQQSLASEEGKDNTGEDPTV